MNQLPKETLRWGRVAICFYLMYGGAAAVAETETFSWRQCAEMASRENAEIRAARYTYDATKELETTARSGFLPQVTLSTTGSRAQERNDRSELKPWGTWYSGNVTVTQNLFAGFQDVGKSRQASANTEAAEQNLNIVRARISYELVTAYEGVLYTKENIKLLQEIIRRREHNLQLVQVRYDNGHENKASVLLSQAYLGESEHEELQAHNALESAQALLRKALGVDSLSLSVTDDPPQSDPPHSQPDMEVLALSTPEVRQAAAQENAAGEAKTITRGPFFPSVALTTSATHSGGDLVPPAEKYYAGVTLTWTLFAGFKDLGNYRNAVGAYYSAASSRRNFQLLALSKLKTAYATYVEAVSRLRVDGKFREAAMLRAEIARAKYNTGLLSFEDWDIAETDLINRQKRYIATKRDRVIAEAAWLQAQGKGLIP